MHFTASVVFFAFTAVVNAVTIDTEGLPDTGLNTSTWSEGTLPPLDGEP